MELDQRQGGDCTTTRAAAAPTEHGSDTKRRCRHSVVMVMAGAVILGFIGLGVNTTVADEVQYRRDMGLRTNPPQRQQEQAQQLLAQLNSHDPAQVHLPTARATVSGPDRIGRNVMAAMPRTECHYTLDSVRDDGVHNDVQIGAPVVAGAKVVAEVVSQGRHDKVTIIKFRRRKHHMKRQGHRQWYTEIKITGIQA